MNRKEIYLAGGCFWGTQQYFRMLTGVLETEVGYANGITQNPTYKEVCSGKAGHAEAVKVEYNGDVITLPFLLDMYYRVIDPVSVNRQGNDTGVQYRTGVYYTTQEDSAVILNSIATLQKSYSQVIAIEVKPLENYYPAESYHQAYLEKNPGGYCHIGSTRFLEAKQAVDHSFNAVCFPNRK